MICNYFLNSALLVEISCKKHFIHDSFGFLNFIQAGLVQNLRLDFVEPPEIAKTESRITKH